MQRSMRHGSRYKRVSGTKKVCCFRGAPKPPVNIEKYIKKKRRGTRK
jgi:hypothetical protein